MSALLFIPLTFLLLLAWVQLLVAVVLSMLVVWQLFDALLDWNSAQYLPKDSVIYLQALGELRLMWLHSIYAALLLTLGVVLITVPPHHNDLVNNLVRFVAFVLTFVQFMKVVTERWTRMTVTRSIKDHRR